MKLNVSSLLRNSEKEISAEAILDYSGVLLQGEPVFTNPVQVKIFIENRAGSLKLFAEISTILSVCCARCLKALEVPLTVEFESLLSEKLQNADAEDILPINDAVVDLEDILYETLVLHVEQRYFCTELCKGLCPVCGQDLNENDCDCKDAGTDPRLAVLKQLLKEK